MLPDSFITASCETFITISTMVPKAFSVTHSLTIKGGFTDKTIAVDTECVDGRHFFGIRSFKDFKLLAAFGLATPVRGQSGKVVKYDYQKCSVLEYVKEQRNKAVTRLLNAAIAADDPMADAIDFDTDVAKRQALFLRYDLPEICTVQLKESELMGESIPGIEASVLTTPNKQGMLKLECVGTLLDSWTGCATQYRRPPSSGIMRNPQSRAARGRLKIYLSCQAPSNIRTLHTMASS